MFDPMHGHDVKLAERPPYARILKERGRSTANTWWILVGLSAWSLAESWIQPSVNHRPFTICPPGADPRLFDWSVYREAPVPIGLVRCGDVDGQQLQSLVRTLIETGAPRVFDLFAGVSFPYHEQATAASQAWVSMERHWRFRGRSGYESKGQ